MTPYLKNNESKKGLGCTAPQIVKDLCSNSKTLSSKPPKKRIIMEKNRALP
jgi:hypothetical protein